MNTDEHRLNELTEATIGCAFRVSNKLGNGYLEKVYRNSLCVELAKLGLQYQKEVRFTVLYDGVEVGEYYADLIVEGCVLVEVKAVRAFDDAHTAQCLNYLACTKLPVCLLINFGKSRVDIKRLVSPSFPS
jgi:GxxExxY protein